MQRICGSGIKRIETIDTNHIVKINETTFEVMVNGVYTFKAIDNVGNETEPYQVTVSNILSTDNYVKEGLVLHLDGMNNTGTGHSNTATIWKDLSRNGNDAKLYGFSYDQTSGWQEDSLRFDGNNDYGEIKDSDSIRVQNQTIEIIVKKDAIINNDRSIFFVKWPGYTLEFNPNTTLAYGKKDGEYLQANTRPELKKWYHITATHENSISKLYINSQYETQQNIVMENYNTNNLSIGNYKNYHFLKGEIKAIRMYNRVLTQAEMEQNAQIDKIRYNLE